MIGSAAYAVVFWALAQVGTPDAGTPAPVSPAASSAVPAPGDGGTPAPAEGAAAGQDAAAPAQEIGPTSADPTAVPEADSPVPEPEAKPKPPPTRAPPPKAKPKPQIAHPNTITVNAGAALLGIYAVALERTLVPHASIVLEAGAIRRSLRTPRGVTTVDGFGFTIAARYYPLGTGPDGLYVGPEVAGYNVVIREPAANDKGTAVGLGLWVGYNFTFFNRLHVAPGVGGNVVLGDLGLHRISFRGYSLAPLARLNVGVAF